MHVPGLEAVALVALGQNLVATRWRCPPPATQASVLFLEVCGSRLEEVKVQEAAEVAVVAEGLQSHLCLEGVVEVALRSHLCLEVPAHCGTTPNS